jgi:cellulose synthase/poly-beta-1,6-N-acetylglucosamine synthase-like glycosyltransferase
MTTFALILVVLPVGFFGYSYFIYPGLLWIFGRFRKPPAAWPDPAVWPTVSISLPAYNEARSIRRTLDSLLAIDYPADRRQILVISDASSDGTDAIVKEYASRGVSLLRLETRGGKTAAENAAGAHLTGDIVINTDATIRILPESVKPLVRVFQDPSIGVASGRDLSVGDIRSEVNEGESGYVGYEMTVRAMETRLGGIIGASGCFYAIRRPLHTSLFPEALSRDFAAALISREHGYRAVSVDEAVCLVPRAASLRSEYKRKIRTMARGLDTLWYKRHLMNPFRHGGFALKLISHKLCRWLVFLTLPLALVGLVILAVSSPLARVGLGLVLAGCLLGVLATRAAERGPVPRLVSALAFVFAANLAGVLAWLKALRGERNPIWEPTRRPLQEVSSEAPGTPRG